MRFEWATGLTEIDAAQILAIINAVASHEGTNGMSRPLTDREGEDFIFAVREAIGRGDCYQLLARAGEDSSIVAIATLERVKLNPARRHVVEVKRMASTPEARAFGNYILAGWRVILDKCREIGCDIINIDVSEDGPYRMWKKLGFRTYAKVPDYARVGARTLDGYFLSVYLEEAYRVLERFQRRALSENVIAGSKV